MSIRPGKKIAKWLGGGIVALAMVSSAPGVLAETVEASKSTQLRPGQKLEGTAYERMMRSYTIQRIGEVVYWIEVKGYSSTVVVGERGLLVIDAPRDDRAPAMIGAIRNELSSLPITTLVYSHYHFDHVGGANAYAEEARRRGTPLRVVASETTARQIERYGDKIPRATQVIPEPFGRFQFEGRTLEMGTPRFGHSPDNSWILLDGEDVLHCVDMVHPGMLEFPGFTDVDDLLGYEEALEELLNLDWTFLVAGHADIGYPEDVRLVLDYLDDVRGAVELSAEGVSLDDFVKEDELFYSWFVSYGDAVSSRAVERLRPKWGGRPSFDLVAKSHAETMFWHLFTH